MTKFARNLAYFIIFAANFMGLEFLVSAQTNAQGRDLSLQVVSYLTAEDAQTEVNRLKGKKLEAYWVKAEVAGMGTRYRVRIGHYSDERSATLGAASACSARAITQYLIAQGDSVPAGVPAKTCGSALAFARGAGESNLAPVTASNNVPKTVKEPISVATNSRPTPAPTPVIKPVAPPPTTPVKNTPAVVANTKNSVANNVSMPAQIPASMAGKGATTNNTLTKNVPGINGNVSQPQGLLPNANREMPRTTTPPRAGSNSNATNGAFIRADKPKDIVTNAFQYANTKMTAANRNDVSISNPRWKVSQNSGTVDQNLRAVYFVDAWTGWAAGDNGVIYQTSDGGKQWMEKRNAVIANKVVDVSKIYFVNENKGWMLAESRTTKSDEPQTVLLSTNDGGQIWQNIAMPNVTSFFFVNERKGWAVGKNGTMMVTSDGGIRWKKIENLARLVGLPVESASSSFGFSDIYFLNQDIGWAVGNFYGRVTTNIGGLFMTADGGETWQRIPLAIQHKTQSTRFTKGRLQTVRFTDVSNGVITGEMEEGNDKFFFTLKTVDGGETWEQTRVPTGAAHNTQFVDGARGWTAAATASGQNSYDTVLFHTNNGGKSWEEDFVAHGQKIHGVYFISPIRGWAVGDRGMILRYDSE